MGRWNETREGLVNALNMAEWDSLRDAHLKLVEINAMTAYGDVVDNPRLPSAAERALPVARRAIDGLGRLSA